MSSSKFQYNFVYMPSHPRASSNGCVYEHILIAEKILGRYLINEAVHHIDGNKKNNNPDNLMIFETIADHSAYHSNSVAWSNDGIIWKASRKITCLKCEYCNKIFTINGGNDSAKRRFCSRECSNKAYGRINNGRLPEIQDLLKQNNGNFSKVGRLLNVTSSGLAKLLKKHNLPNHSKDYKNMGA